MGDVKLENGFTRIANELLENIAKVKLSPTQHSLIYIIWRYTYGFNRKEHTLSLSFLSKATECDKRNIQRELKRLEDRNIIIQSIIRNNRIISFNKNYHDWDKDATSKDNGEIDIGEIDNSRNRQADIGEIDNISIGEIDNQERKKEKLKEISAFFEKVWSLYPNKKGKGQISATKKKELYKLGDEFERCISRYIKDVEEQRKNGFKDLNYKNGSTFFNSGYVDYLDENYNQREKEVIDPYAGLDTY